MLDNACFRLKMFNRTVLFKIKIERKGFVSIQLKMYTLSGYFLTVSDQYEHMQSSDW